MSTPAFTTIIPGLNNTSANILGCSYMAHRTHAKPIECAVWGASKTYVAAGQVTTLSEKTIVISEPSGAEVVIKVENIAAVELIS